MTSGTPTAGPSDEKPKRKRKAKPEDHHDDAHDDESTPSTLAELLRGGGVTILGVGDLAEAVRENIGEPRQYPEKPPPKQSKAELMRERAERAKRALDMRTKRHSYQRIADECGYATRGAAHAAIQRELAKIPRESAKELRASELEMLDLVQANIVNALMDGDLWAIDRYLKIVDMRAKLTGIYEVQADTGVDEVRGVLAAFMGTVREQADEDEREDAAAANDEDAAAPTEGESPRSDPEG